MCRNTASRSIVDLTAFVWGGFTFGTPLDEAICKEIGHIGYAGDDAHQRNGYATRAIRLIIGIARYFEIDPLWVLIVPDNIPSRRAAERAGFALHDVIESTPLMESVGILPSVCRYRVRTV